LFERYREWFTRAENEEEYVKSKEYRKEWQSVMWTKF
jgi:hypothetical protein